MKAGCRARPAPRGRRARRIPRRPPSSGASRWPGHRPGHDPGDLDERRAAADPPRRADPPGRAGLGGEPLDQVAEEDHRRRRTRPRASTCRPATRCPRSPRRRASTSKPADLVPVTTMNVKSLIARPIEGDAEGRPGRGPGRRLDRRGGRRTRSRSRPAPTAPGPSPRSWARPRPGTWRRLGFTWDAQPGRHALRARATDSTGETQPEATPWNRSGYLWNGIDRVTCEVR